MKIYNHGEICIFESKKSIPSNAKKMKPEKIGYIIAPSEQTGNHHVLEAKDSVELYEKDGIMWLKTDEPVNVFCVIKERHDTITLEPGIYEIEPAKEFDYYSASKRNVAD